MTCPPNAFVTGIDLLTIEPDASVTQQWGIRAAITSLAGNGVVRASSVSIRARSAGVSMSSGCPVSPHSTRRDQVRMRAQERPGADVAVGELGYLGPVLAC